MKKIFLSVLILSGIVLLSSCSKKPQLKGTFNVEPEKPKAGDEITVYYSADSTNLSKAENIEMICYQYGTDVYDTKAIPMNKDGNYWSAKLNLTDTTKGVLFNFKNGDDIDNRNSKGYVVFLYGDDGKILPGSKAGFGNAINTWGAWYADLDRDAVLALDYFKTDFDANPDVKNDYLDAYFKTVMRAYKKQAPQIISTDLRKLTLENPTSERDLTNLAIWYGRLNENQLANRYKKMIEQKYPKSHFVQLVRYTEFNDEKDIAKKIELAKKFEKDFPNSDYIETIYGSIANYFRNNNEFKNALEFLKTNSKETSPYTFYAVSAVMLNKNADAKDALEIAKIGVEKSKKNYENPSNEKPNYQTKEQWNDDRAYLYGMNLYSYGRALNELGKKDEALKSLDKAVTYTKQQDGDVNSLYAKLMMENKKYDEILSRIPEFIKKGNETPEMSGILKEAYVKKNGSEKGYDEFIGKLNSTAKSNLITKLKKEMLDKDAPDFILTDLRNKPVRLSDYKGKTVVLDFWATWCGPCKASFPGMEKAVEKFSKDKDVQFLFVNTWEKVKDKKNNAQNFIKEHKYPFHVLLDLDNKVIDSYKVSGIPTKFIIDKNGKIRFMSVGYSGNENQLVDEISTMISMVK